MVVVVISVVVVTSVVVVASVVVVTAEAADEVAAQVSVEIGK